MTGEMQDQNFRGEVLRHGYTLEYALESVGPGWADLVRAAYQACEDADIRIVQVKEKFGGLRIYYEGTRTDRQSDDHVWDLINALEAKSLRTCETCGGRGKPRSGGWIKTLCEEHADGREETRLFDNPITI